MQEAVRARDAEIARLSAQGGQGISNLDAAALQLRAEAHEGVILQLNQQAGSPCIPRVGILPFVLARGR
jgi:hypothetical protein